MLLLLNAVFCIVNLGYSVGFDKAELETLRSSSLDLFYHGYNNYIQHAFPCDELMPVSCKGIGPDFEDPTNIGRNDVLGNYSMTLIDSLDMFPIIGDDEGFQRGIDHVREHVSFNVSTTVQVFESTIRGMGGLISAHLYASTPRLGHAVDSYDGHLLKLAYDLGVRLLQAFVTETGIPLPRVNLRDGFVKIGNNFITETCSSGAGSLVLEFGMLSRLTGDRRFEKAARRAFFQLWARRSSSNMIGMSIDSVKGYWQSGLTGNGASIDSYYEYALKYYILFGDDSFLKVFTSTYRALNTYSFDGWKYDNVNFQTGHVLTSWIDALAAFFPSIQVLYGDIDSAIRTHFTYLKLWNTYAGIPERWDYTADDYSGSVPLEWYPLRPEFVESNYYLYRAVRDPIYLQMGKTIIQDLNRYYRTDCGFAGMQDVRTGAISDRMESFFLSETAKYLYLLFDETHPLNKELSNFVFSTEAHPFWYDDDILRHSSVVAFPDLLEYVQQTLNNSNAFLDLPKFTNVSKKMYHSSLLWSKIRRICLMPFNLLISTCDNVLKGFLSSMSFLLVDSPLIQKHKFQQSNSHSRPLNETGEMRWGPMISEPVCQVIPRPNFFSSIASWEEYYTLDSKYTYFKPAWHGYRPSLEQDADFRQFVDPNSMCLRRPRSHLLDIVVHIPSGDKVTDVEISSGHDNLQLIRSKNLNGVRLTVELDGLTSYGQPKYRIIKFQNIPVEGQIVLDEWLYADTELLSRNKRGFQINGVEITNMMIDPSAKSLI